MPCKEKLFSLSYHNFYTESDAVNNSYTHTSGGTFAVNCIEGCRNLGALMSLGSIPIWRGPVEKSIGAKKRFWISYHSLFFYGKKLGIMQIYRWNKKESVAYQKARNIRIKI